MSAIQFEETETTKLLSRLPKNLRAAFVAACAERLRPFWRRYAAKTLGNGPTNVDVALDALWCTLKDPSKSRSEFEALKDQVLESMPDEDEAWDVGEPYAEDAAAVVVYGLRALSDESTESAFYAARRMYEVLDNYVANLEDDLADRGDKAKALAECSGIIASELARQTRDLRGLISPQPDEIERLRERAISESKQFLSVS